MTELKQKFISIAQVALVEFSINHPGHSVAAQMMERFFDVPEEAIVRAYEEAGNLVSPVEQYIRYLFTGGRNGYSKPEWLKDSQ
jgi:hypothetical protein